MLLALLLTAAEISGFADLHLHQMSHLAFGGRFIWGSPVGAPDKAMPACSGSGNDHGFLAGFEGGMGNFTRHGPRDWPHFFSTSHQQSHATWLEKAHKEGLQLMVMSAVEQKDFCALIPGRKVSCHDFESARRQLDAAHAFSRAHPWYAIVKSPAEARAAIAAGKLAVVLAVEAGDVFEGADPRRRLDELHALGVRSIQLVHETDNRMGGAAPHEPAVRIVNIIHNVKESAKNLKARLSRVFSTGKGKTEATQAAAKLASRFTGFKLDKQGRNKKGLSPEGKAVVAAMMDKRMLVDVSHMSTRAIQDAFAIAKARRHYPLFNSHAHLSDAEKKKIGEWHYGMGVYRIIAETGGVIGLRTGPHATPAYAGSGVPNDCEGSTKSFAQTLAWAGKELHLSVAFGSDFGGMASNLAPRFGKYGCNKNKAQQKRQKGRTGGMLDERGLGHVGLLGDVLRELKALRAHTAPLERSAEDFVRMWERAHDDGRKPLAARFDDRRALATLK